MMYDELIAGKARADVESYLRAKADKTRPGTVDMEFRVSCLLCDDYARRYHCDDATAWLIEHLDRCHPGWQNTQAQGRPPLGEAVP